MTDSEFQKAVLERFEAMDARFDALEGKVDQGFARGRTVRLPRPPTRLRVRRSPQADPQPGTSSAALAT